ncbi:hypothetical protein PFDG_02784 [Plasmodium falciparum Dd2]|uniref:Uncharacterized protein n=1 Tax=Plasmodium falciparum (isolate Dd2) TaxID=57267 RepID=A0A0L7M234_PLAF4|nr:hypothetical protein PFDG_02784 [Plasmodium falciparum Dd2]
MGDRCLYINTTIQGFFS